jgi:hypothetical protein
LLTHQEIKDRAAHDGTCLRDLLIREAVVHEVPVLAGLHDAALAHDRKVLGGRRLRDLEIGGQVAHRALRLAEEFDDLEPLGVGEDGDDPGLDLVEGLVRRLHDSWMTQPGVYASFRIFPYICTFTAVGIS